MLYFFFSYAILFNSLAAEDQIFTICCYCRFAYEKPSDDWETFSVDNQKNLF